MVEKAGAIKPGLYNIYLSRQADKSKSHDGLVLHADKEFVYQQVGKTYITHALEGFATAPETGSIASISYEADKVLIATRSVKQERKLSR